MSDGIYSIGVSGLLAAQAGLVTTGHNIANASTEGYHRQAIHQSTAIPLATGSGFFGQGTQVDTVLRAYSGFVENQLVDAQAQANYYTTYHAQLSRIDNIVADNTAGLSPALQDFFVTVPLMSQLHAPTSPNAAQFGAAALHAACEQGWTMPICVLPSHTS